jgi:hypothetical protein
MANLAMNKNNLPRARQAIAEMIALDEEHDLGYGPVLSSLKNI